MKTVHRLPKIAAILAALACAGVVSAQNSTPTQPLPGLDDFSLPASRPPPRPQPSPEPTTNAQPASAATPRAAVTPRAAPLPRATTVPRANPTARTTPLPRPSATAKRPAAPLPQPTPEPIAQPTFAPVVPTPDATVAVAPTPTPTQAPVALRDAASTTPWLWRALGGLLALGAVIAVALMLRRRAPQSDHQIFELGAVAPPPPQPTAVPAPQPAPIPVSPAPEPAAAPATRATLDLTFTPRRAGTNLLSAAVEYHIVVRNTGAAAATGIRVDVRLIGAGQGQDALISALFAEAVAQPITAPFDLPPGTGIELGGMAMHPKDTLVTMEAGGRTLFVPVVAVHVRYAWDGGEGRTARSYVVGIDRGAQAKLAPFRLGADARMYEEVRALDYIVSAVS